jgi:tetratricopeptide (TPR) repeat protein
VQILAQVADRRAEVSTAHSDLGMALLAAGRLDEALAAFNRARTLDPQSAQVHCGLGLVYQQQGRWWEAADAYRMTEHLAPQNPVGPMNLGAVLGILGEHEQARAALQRATALAPADQEIREALEQLAVPEAVHDEVTRPALRADQFKASITGDLKTFQLLDVFEFLRIQIKTGSLVISSRRGAATIRVVRGRLDSAAAPGIKRLGEALVARGAITPAQLDLALSRQQEAKDKGKGKGGEGALGALLVREGALDGAQLGAVVLRQIVGALDEVLGWSEGTFAFNEAAEDSPPPISFDLQEVTLELVKMRDETRRPTRPNAT